MLTLPYSVTLCPLGIALINIWAPFALELDWQIARWVKLHGPSSTSLNELLTISELPDSLGLSFKSHQKLNQIIDEQLPGRPPFCHEDIVIAGVTVLLYYCDIIECVKAPFGDPQFAPYLHLTPEQHFYNDTCIERVYHDMNTGDWWWVTQMALEAVKPDATIVPVIISLNKTQLTLFGDKSAYLMYVTIGNISKAIQHKLSCRAAVLLAYLPIAKLKHVTNIDSHCRATGNLVHAALGHILQPMAEPGHNGMLMATGSRIVLHAHPILACDVLNYPEQCSTTCGKYGNCFWCTCARECLDLDSILKTLLSADDLTPLEFEAACEAADIRPIYEPFWVGPPYVNIFRSTTADNLHQLGGVVKHLVKWVSQAYGHSAIDARCYLMPKNHNLQHFSGGILKLQRPTGMECANVCHILLGIIVGLWLPSNVNAAPLIHCVHAALDYFYVTQYPLQTSVILQYIKDTLNHFHANKFIFLTLGIHTHFNIPKIHSMQHFISSIQLFGSTDNFNTAYFERLHIDWTKNAYRATNKKADHIEQMTMWVMCREKVLWHLDYVAWHQQDHPHIPPLPHSDIPHCMHIHIAKYLNYRNVLFDELALAYGACDFEQGQQDAPDTLDCANANPPHIGEDGKLVSSRFDTILVRKPNSIEEYGVHAFHVAQLCAVFSLPRTAEGLFPEGVSPPPYLAYIEWFSPFLRSADNTHGMYRISCSFKGEKRAACLAPCFCYASTVHLYSCLGPVVPPTWTSDNILEECSSFYVNPFLDRHTHLTVY
ncbi:hypothetical protein BC834DRAFT_926493 [Gloeopeniophorella convolvens]|nr:hypothetical protein BC834DRAFT_926493 [Gloeopeniophorella convolvens]